VSDNWIRAGRAAVILVALVTAAISFTHIRDLAMAHGGDSLTAPLLPLAIDGAVAAFTVFMHQASGLALWLSRCGLLLAIGMTVAFNTAYGATDGVWGAVIWSCPAVLLVICIEVSVLTVRKTRPAPAMVKETAPEVKTAPPVAAMVKPTVTVTPATMTVKQQAKLEGVSERTMYRRLAAVNGNGRAHG